MLDIFTYSNYRSFIKDFYETRKAVNPSFSFRYLSQKAGINSSAFFKFLIEGKRNLTPGTVLKVCAALKLRDREAEYFENLVYLNQAKTIEEKNKFFEKLVQCQTARHVAKIEEERYDYFGEWYHCIIRELVTFVDFKEDYAKLGKMLMPPISAKEAEKSIQLLLKLGFLAKSEGKFVQTDPVLATGPGIRAQRVISFQIKMLQMAIEAFDRCKPEQRLNSSTTLAVSKSGFATAVRIMRECRSQLLELARSEQAPGQAYQLNISLVPMTQPKEEI